MKKVLAIAPYSYLPYSSGGQKFIALFFEYLGKEVDLTVISVRENNFTLSKNYRAIPFLKKSFSRYLDPTLSSKIISLVKKEKYDCIIWEHPYYAWLAYRIKKNTGITTILHTHNIEYQRFKTLGRWWWPVLKVYEKWFFQLADYIFFITPEDKNFAVKEWEVPQQKCIDVPFGIETREYPKDKVQCREILRQKHAIGKEETIILFNGVLSYKPNLDALTVILDQINPMLLSHPNFKYKILICGKGLPSELDELKKYREKNIIYAGFVDNIDIYFKGADLFMNPVQSGGGVKTKMVEAIGFGTTVVATQTGAIGIDKKVCGQKLVKVKDNDWVDFAKAILENASLLPRTPSLFYHKYYWQNIIKENVLLV